VNRPFAIYSGALDADELGYWRFGEAGGRLTPVGAGPAFVNNGAVAGQDGYEFVHTDPDHMDAPYAGQPARAALTLEMWVRAWAVPEGAFRAIGYYYRAAGPPGLSVAATRFATPANSFIGADLGLGGGCRAIWGGADADAVLASPNPWHVAIVFENGSPTRLFVNGVLVASSALNIGVDMAAGDYTLRLGDNSYLTTPLSAVLDEVRLSCIVRYTANFPITRFGEGRRALARGPGTRAGLCAGVVG